MRPLPLLLSCIALAAGCSGTLDEKYPSALTDGDGPDGGAACDEPTSSGHDGKHYPGEACLTCHDGASAPRFTVGGTLYTDLAGTATLADATIHILDAEGNDVALIAAANGNFWSTQSFAYPLTTYASMCPDDRDMIAPLDESGGDCNKAGCHAAGFRVALP